MYNNIAKANTTLAQGKNVCLLSTALCIYQPDIVLECL